MKHRIRAVLHYKKPAFWVILAAIVICIALCLGFLTKPVSADDSTDTDSPVVSPSPTPLHEGQAISANDLKSAIERSLNGASIDYSQADLSDDFYRSYRFECTALNIDYITTDGTVRSGHPITVNLIYSGGKFAVDTFAPEEEIATFLLTDEPIPVSVCPSANTMTNASLLVTVNPGTGEILTIACSIAMDSSFKGYENLYNAISTHKDLHPLSTLTLVAATEYKGSSYAVVQYQDGRETKSALLEYRTDHTGTRLLTWCDSEMPNTAYGLWKTGFQMNSASMSEHYIYWSVIADTRIATSPDGTESDHNSLVETDFTAMRFVFQDLSYVDVPINGKLFITDLESAGVTPPRICVPIAGDTLLSALGMPEPLNRQATYFDR